MANLQTYLSKIASHIPINYQEFKKKLPANILLDHHLYFKPQKSSNGLSLVTVLNQNLFESLIAAKPKTRKEAADNGDSHQTTTSFSHLLVYHEGLLDDRPDTVLIDDRRIVQVFESKPQLLVIENEENFFCYKSMLPILSSFYGHTLNFTNTDIVWGAGNRINKGLNKRFIEQYDTVLCAFDYDFGGLVIFKTLQANHLGITEFLMPSDFTTYLPMFNKSPNQGEHWVKALTLADELGFLALKAAFNRSHNQFMEQESLLNR
jgi:hypothetical protein